MARTMQNITFERHFHNTGSLVVDAAIFAIFYPLYSNWLVQSSIIPNTHTSCSLAGRSQEIACKFGGAVWVLVLV